MTRFLLFKYVVFVHVVSPLPVHGTQLPSPSFPRRFGFLMWFTPTQQSNTKQFLAGPYQVPGGVDQSYHLLMFVVVYSMHFPYIRDHSEPLGPLVDVF